jgi:sugar phosphate isomerase/epimerase
MYSRREFGKMALAGLPLSAAAIAAAKPNSVIDGVHVGLQTYSFRDFPPEGVQDAIIKAMTQIGLYECEMTGPHANPDADAALRRITQRPPGQAMDDAMRRKVAEARKSAEEDARKWHLTVSLDHFKAIRRKFEAAGIEIYGYNGGRFGSDEETEKSFEHAKALGAAVLTWSGTLSVAQKVAPLADRYKMTVAAHGHSSVNDPDQFATPDSFKKVMAMSKYFMINLDVGHYLAGGFDPVAFLQEFHERIPVIHLKDRKKNQGPNTPFGEGDTPIKEVMQLIKRNKWPIRAYIEYEYQGKESSPAEVQKCFNYIKAALAREPKA